MMFDENAFSTDAFSTDSWLFLFDVPYQDLTGVQSIFVKSVVEAIYGVSAARQIVSLADEQNISIIQAATDLVIQRKVKRAASKSAPTSTKAVETKKPVEENTTCYAVSSEEAAYVVAERIDTLVQSESAAATFIASPAETLFITRKPRRDALKG